MSRSIRWQCGEVDRLQANNRVMIAKERWCECQQSVTFYMTMTRDKRCCDKGPLGCRQAAAPHGQTQASTQPQAQRHQISPHLDIATRHLLRPHPPHISTSSPWAPPVVPKRPTAPTSAPLRTDVDPSHCPPSSPPPESIHPFHHHQTPESISPWSRNHGSPRASLTAATAFLLLLEPQRLAAPELRREPAGNAQLAARFAPALALSAGPARIARKPSHRKARSEQCFCWSRLEIHPRRRGH